MDLRHRISFNSSPAASRELAALGLLVPADGFQTVVVDESTVDWPLIQAWIDRWHPVDFVEATFTKAEVDSAEWLELLPSWHHGYPQPNEDDFGYLQATYDASERCTRCCVGLRQKAPFQMRREPKWGTRSILQMNWVFDEFFVKPELWEAVFKSFGIEHRIVITPKGEELRTVVQLVVDEEVAVVPDPSTANPCSTCGRERFFQPIGFFPPLAEQPSGAMVRTKQSFGDGSMAMRPVLVNADLRTALVEARVRGAYVRPVQSS